MPPADWTRRPNARDDLKAQARNLRSQGLDYDEIVAALGVSKSSVSLWVRDLPRPARVEPAACAERFWLGVTGARPGQFRRTSLKPANPQTNRRNTGNDYHGRLRVEVLGGRELYLRIEGWISALSGTLN